MALHTDTHHPHVHLTVRTVGHDGVKLFPSIKFGREGVSLISTRGRSERFSVILTITAVDYPRSLGMTHWFTGAIVS